MKSSYYDDPDLLSLSRKSTFSERFVLGCYLSDTAIDAMKSTLRWCHPEATEDEIGVLFVAMNYGEELAERMRTDLELRSVESREPKQF